MREYIKGLTPATEFVIVVLVAFGYLIFGSILSALHPGGGLHHSHASLIALVVYEAALIAVLATFLGLRGWTPKRIGLVPGLRDTGIGFLLFIAANLIWLLVWNATSVLSPGLAQTMAAASAKVVAPGVPVAVAAVVSIVNPVFEEGFVAGYVMSALRDKWSPLVCVNASVAIRLLYHLYQGPLGVLSIVPTGLIFAYWYVRTGRLWPLIVAHALLDLLALLSV
jgi:CAAX protease family protein